MTPHLRGQVRAYVDRSLPAALLHVFDQHLVACEVCRAIADQERRIVAALRADTGVPQSLRSALMGLAADPVPLAPPVPAAPARVRIHLLESPFRDRPPAVREPLETVSPTAPALHRSPMRAAVVASLAATASVAAAWGLTVAPLATGAARAQTRLPVGVSSPGAASVGLIASTATGGDSPGTSAVGAQTAGARGAGAPSWENPVPRTISAGVGGRSGLADLGSVVGGGRPVPVDVSGSGLGGGAGLLATGSALFATGRTGSATASAPAFSLSRYPVFAPVRISVVGSAQSTP